MQRVVCGGGCNRNELGEGCNELRSHASAPTIYSHQVLCSVFCSPNSMEGKHIGTSLSPRRSQFQKLEDVQNPRRIPFCPLSLSTRLIFSAWWPLRSGGPVPRVISKVNFGTGKWGDGNFCWSSFSRSVFIPQFAQPFIPRSGSSRNIFRSASVLSIQRVPGSRDFWAAFPRRHDGCKFFSVCHLVLSSELEPWNHHLKLIRGGVFGVGLVLPPGGFPIRREPGPVIMVKIRIIGTSVRWRGCFNARRSIADVIRSLPDIPDFKGFPAYKEFEVQTI